ncbi:MAG: hypothetical protein ACFWUC_01575 [Oscillospiraceae bacterium]
MLIAIEHQDSPICEIIHRNQPSTGVAFLPAIAMHFLHTPRELHLQYQNGRLRYDLMPHSSDIFQPEPGDAIELYRETAASFAPKTKDNTEKSLNELA